MTNIHRIPCVKAMLSLSYTLVCYSRIVNGGAHINARYVKTLLNNSISVNRR